MRPSWIPFGVIARAHGVRGELRVRPDDPDTPLPPQVTRVCARARDGEAQVFEVAGRRAIHRAVLLTLVGIEDRDAARALTGRRLEVDATELPPPHDGEVYVYELEGVDVVDPAGVRLGTVRRLLQSPAHDLLEIETPGGVRLLPWVDAFIGELDREARRLTVAPPDGWLEI